MLEFATHCSAIANVTWDGTPCATATPPENTSGHEAATRTLQAHEHLFHECDEASHFFEVMEGAFCVYKLFPDGRRHIVSFALPGDLVGFGSEDLHTLSAEAIEASTVCPISFNSLDQAVEMDPDLARTLLHHARQELADARSQLVTVARKSALEKLATFLMALSNRNRKHGRDENVVTLPMTRSDIADFLGLTLETVSRTFSKLKRAGVIDLPQYAHVIVRDRDELEALAEV